MPYNPYGQLPEGFLDQGYADGFRSRPMRSSPVQGQPDFSANEMPSPSDRWSAAVNEGGAFSRGSMRAGPANAGALGTWRPTAPSLRLAGPTTVRKDYDAWRAAGGGSIDGRAVTGNASMGYSGGGGYGGGYGGGGRIGRLLPYGTGERRPKHYPEGLDNNPSPESQAAAAINDQERYLKNLNNSGAGGRIEDVMAAGRSNAEMAARSAGYAPGSLAAIQSASSSAINAADVASGREAALAAQLKRDQFAGSGELSRMRRAAADSLYGQWSDQERLRMAQEQANFLRQRQ